ncbi:hypothetical protein EHM76_05240 [bacterium]|nr:MAG: hypothetical protein EHM76_05240 [bacterium]
MKEENLTIGMDESDVKVAIESLNSPVFKSRFVNISNNAPDPAWSLSEGQPLNERVRELSDRFRKDIGGIQPQQLHNGVFQKLETNTLITIAQHRPYQPVVPTASDLFHVYGPDRNNTNEWRRYYRYAWKEKGPHAIIYSTDDQIRREGKLMCESYAYSGQSSYAIVGAGLLFSPLFGDAIISIRPYVQWLTSASFTGSESAPATAIANLGIYVESWGQGGKGHYVDRDLWLPVWSQNTQSYLVNTTAGGAATVTDGLATEVLAVTQRKYAIFVYAYLETSAGPQQQKNETRFVRVDIDATVPYVVVEEKLI